MQDERQPGVPGPRPLRHETRRLPRKPIPSYSPYVSGDRPLQSPVVSAPRSPKKIRRNEILSPTALPSGAGPSSGPANTRSTVPKRPATSSYGIDETKSSRPSSSSGPNTLQLDIDGNIFDQDTNKATPHAKLSPQPHRSSSEARDEQSNGISSHDVATRMLGLDTPPRPSSTVARKHRKSGPAESPLQSSVKNGQATARPSPLQIQNTDPTTSGNYGLMALESEYNGSTPAGHSINTTQTTPEPRSDTFSIGAKLCLDSLARFSEVMHKNAFDVVHLVGELSNTIRDSADQMETKQDSRRAIRDEKKLQMWEIKRDSVVASYNRTIDLLLEQTDLLMKRPPRDRDRCQVVDNMLMAYTRKFANLRDLQDKLSAKLTIQICKDELANVKRVARQKTHTERSRRDRYRSDRTSDDLKCYALREQIRSLRHNVHYDLPTHVEA
ncbi:hypothetical protein PLICRDRAFT_170119 [Plicaturopsis crispa FD-325 SS-3]|nr:hypothetical protein PLICRDRAFT_170119 [Plicaturopsis crispa FD-325 SS-3]